MTILTVEEQKEIPILPVDSIIFTKIDSIVLKKVNEGTPNEWTKAEFKFKILGIQATGDGSPVSAYDNLIGENIFGSVSARITNHPENKLRLWAEEILQMDLGVGFNLDLRDLEGRQVRAITSTYTKRNTNTVRHQVESLLRMGEAQAPRMPATPAQIAQEQQMGWGAPAQPPVADPWAQQQQPAQPPAYPGVATQQPAQPAQGGGWGNQGGGGWDDGPGF